MVNISIFGNLKVYLRNLLILINIDNKKKYFLLLGEGPTQGLNGTTLTVEKMH